ncbi:MAG: hypothetical protein NVSMB32_08350 [Actinomycetota bacterium]
MEGEEEGWATPGAGWAAAPGAGVEGAGLEVAGEGATPAVRAGATPAVRAGATPAVRAGATPPVWGPAGFGWGLILNDGGATTGWATAPSALPVAGDALPAGLAAVPGAGVAGWRGRVTGAPAAGAPAAGAPGSSLWSLGPCDPKNLRRIIAYLLAFILGRLRLRPLIASAIAFCSSGERPISDSPSSTSLA